MIQTPTAVGPTDYGTYISNCTRNPACEPSWLAPLPAVSVLQLYADFLLESPGDFEFTLVDVCTGATEQITPEEYVIGQTPELNYYGVFKAFNNPTIGASAFVVHLAAGGKTFFSEMLSVEPCVPLMKVKSCHPQAATNTGFDINGIYYGLSIGGTLGDAAVRYFHIAWVRNGKVKETANRAIFKSSLYFNFRTQVEKTFLFEPGEFVPKWFKNVLLAIYSRGAISVNDGTIYIVSDIAFAGLNDDDLQWRANAQLKEAFKLFYGCDDGTCEECCTPTLISASVTSAACCDPVVISATAEPDGDSGSASDSDSASDSGSASGSASDSGSESEPGGPALRLLFDDIAEADTLVGDSGNVADWETFFGTTFTAVSVAGNEVSLFGGSAIALAPDLFESYEHLISVFDDAECVVSIGGNCFYTNTILEEVYFPAVTTISTGAFSNCGVLATANIPLLTAIPGACFYLCSALTTLICPLITSIGNNGLAATGLITISFPDCVTLADGACSGFNATEVFDFPSVTTVGVNCFSFLLGVTDIYLPLCSDLGGTGGDDFVFNGTSGMTLTLTILTATAGDGDVVYLQANNTVTLIPV